MRVVRAIGGGFKNFMIIFSFIVNVVLVAVVVVLLATIFDIKHNIATPLVGGLHSSFVGLDRATIDYTIPVRDTIPVVMNIPLETDTVVTLTQAVPMQVSAVINLPGVGTLNNAQVNLQLPAGLQLPVRLDLDVPVNEDLDVALDVRAVIPLRETQLHDALDNLRLLFEPLALGLHNLPDNYDEAGQLAGDLLAGNPPDLLAPATAVSDPWPGYSTTAGLNYALVAEQAPPANQPLETQLVPVGGIPALDAQLRPDVYAQGGPESINTSARQALAALGIPAAYYDGSYHEAVYALHRDGSQAPTAIGVGPSGMETADSAGVGALTGEDHGILPPSGG